MLVLKVFHKPDLHSYFFSFVLPGYIFGQMRKLNQNTYQWGTLGYWYKCIRILSLFLSVCELHSVIHEILVRENNQGLGYK